MKRIILILLLLFLGVTNAHASQQGVFSFHCDFSHSAMEDPIVFPGQTEVGHMHDFIGNKTTGALSTLETMVGQETTCNVSLDSGAYWVPQLLNNGAPVPIKDVIVYYKGTVGKTIAHPSNMKIIAGATVGRPTGTTGVQAVGWQCRSGTTVYASPVNCGNKGLRAQITFPECWNGVDLDSTNHNSHMAYKSGKKCPLSHPVEVPRIELNVTYDLKDGTNARLASDMEGMANGTSLHADFWNTWNQAELDTLVQTCVNQDVKCADLIR